MVYLNGFVALNYDEHSRVKESFRDSGFVENDRISKLDRFSCVAFQGVHELSKQISKAGLSVNDFGLVVGNHLGGWQYGEKQLENLLNSGPSAVRPFQATAWFPAAVQGEISIAHGILGWSKTVSSGELSGVQALELAVNILELQELTDVLLIVVDSYDSNFVLSSLDCIDFSERESGVFLWLSNKRYDCSLFSLVESSEISKQSERIEFSLESGKPSTSADSIFEIITHLKKREFSISWMLNNIEQYKLTFKRVENGCQESFS